MRRLDKFGGTALISTGILLSCCLVRTPVRARANVPTPTATRAQLIQNVKQIGAITEHAREGRLLARG